MPIIFGWGRRTVKSIGVVFKNLCNNCHNEEYWVMTKVVTWFTLFFIPIIPYETKYFLSCPVCKYGVTLDDNQLEKLKPIAETNQLFAEGKITQEDYAARLNELNSDSTNQVEAKVEETKALTENTPSLVICPECGQKVSEKSKFCGKCGISTTINSASTDKQAPFISDKLVINAPGQGGAWYLPPLDLLSNESIRKADRGDIKKIAAKIEETLKSFGIGAKIVEVNLGPAVTQYALQIPPGTKISKITNLSNDLALNTEAPTGQIRIEAPIPGRNLIGIEIPNRSLEVVTLRTILSSDMIRKNKSKLAVSLGLDVSGYPVVADIAKMPHVLVAGVTGSGKSVLLHSFIVSLLFRATPDEVKLILIDPKRVELTVYNGIPHLMTPVIVEVDQVLVSLKWAMSEMDRRYKTFAEQGVRNIDSYSELAGFQKLPYIVIFIDELADLMAYAPVEVEDAIDRLAKKGRATGIYLVVSTQRPSAKAVKGLITKANFPCRIAFNVSSAIDSKIVIDIPGAEKLLGHGDMLYMPSDYAKPQRVQGDFVSEKEIKKLVDFLKIK